MLATDAAQRLAYGRMLGVEWVATSTLALELTSEAEPEAKASSGIDEVYVVAGHKGQPADIAKRGGSSAVAG